MAVIVIHEYDYEFKESCVIGVADSIENAELLIEDYYGIEYYKEEKKVDIREGGLEYEKYILVKYPTDAVPSRYKLLLEWFTLNHS